MWEGTVRGCGGSRNILADESPVRAEQLGEAGRPVPAPPPAPGPSQTLENMKVPKLTLTVDSNTQGRLKLFSP